MKRNVAPVSNLGNIEFRPIPVPYDGVLQFDLITLKPTGWTVKYMTAAELKERYPKESPKHRK